MSEYVSKQRIRYNIHFDKIKELVEAGNMWEWNDAIKVNDSDSIGRSLGFINMGQSKYLKDPNNNILEGFSKGFIDELIDMQNDFVDGSLGTKEAEGIVDRVVEEIEKYDAIYDQYEFRKKLVLGFTGL